ncbi:MAG: glycosyltransferase family 2 protein [Candidatus Magasanikiibacteriota bacterium]
MKRISIVLPVFNEEKSLEELMSRLRQMADKEMNYEFEFIFINDGSRDKSLEKLYNYSINDKRIKVIDFSRNFGHQPAVSAGIEHALGEAIIIMDSDLQDPPEFISSLLKKWEEGFEVVYAVRKKRKENILKRVCYNLFYLILNKISTVYIPRDSGDFSLIDKKVVKEMITLKERIKFIRGIRAWVGFRQIGLEYERDARFAGETSYNFRALIRIALDAIFSFSFLPLKLPFYVGFFGLFMSLVIIVYLIIMYFFTGFLFENKWVYVIAATFIMLNLNFFFLGIFAIYFSRLIDEVKERPLYIINKKINFD